MRQDPSTMTRDELMTSSRGLLIITAIAFVPLATVLLLDVGVEVEVAAILAGFVGVITGLAGLYMGIRGLLRPASWRPSRSEWVPRDVDFAPHERWFRKSLAEEIPQATISRIDFEEIEIGTPEDSRNALDRFIDGRTEVVEHSRLIASVAHPDRTFEAVLYLGRCVDFAHTIRTRITLSTACRKGEDGFPPAWTMNPDVLRYVAPLVRPHADGISNPEARFEILDGRAVLNTMWESRGMGAFIGFEDFLNAVRAAERADV